MPRPVDAVKARTFKRIGKKKLPPNLAASEVLVDWPSPAPPSTLTSWGCRHWGFLKKCVDEPKKARAKAGAGHGAGWRPTSYS